MEKTELLELPLYELDDMANLDDGYNNAMNKLDDYAKSTNAHFPITSSDIEDGTINTVDLANGCVTDNKLGTASVTADKIATGAVDTDSIADGAVTADKIADNAVGTANIEDGAVTADKIAANAIDTDSIPDGAVTNVKIANNAVDTDNIADGAVTNVKIANNAVDTDNIADGAVTNVKIANNAVNTANIVNGAVTADKIADGVIPDVVPNKPLTYVVIGDSYSYNHKWQDAFNSATGATDYTYAVQGAGYAKVSTDGKSFPVLASDAVAALTSEQRNDVNVVIVYGGSNDYQYQDSDITTGMVSTINTLKNGFPNAKIFIVGPESGNSFGDIWATRIVRVQQINAYRNNVIYVNAIDWLWGSGNYSTDNFHPKDPDGYMNIASKMQTMLYGNASIPPRNITVSLSSGAGWQPDNPKPSVGMAVDGHSNIIHINGYYKFSNLQAGIPAAVGHVYGVEETIRSTGFLLRNQVPVGVAFIEGDSLKCCTFPGTASEAGAFVEVDIHIPCIQYSCALNPTIT